MAGGLSSCLRYPFRGKNDRYGIQDIKTVRICRTVFKGGMVHRNSGYSFPCPVRLSFLFLLPSAADV